MIRHAGLGLRMNPGVPLHDVNSITFHTKGTETSHGAMDGKNLKKVPSPVPIVGIFQ